MGEQLSQIVFPINIGYFIIKFLVITTFLFSCRDAHGAILVYDVSEPKSLAKLNEWVEELQVYSTKKNIVCLVVGNKIDKV